MNLVAQIVSTKNEVVFYWLSGGKRISPMFKRKEWANIWLHEFRENDYKEMK